MLWLMEQGCYVFGIELSELAVKAFFTEHQLPFEVIQREHFSCYASEGIEIWCGDIFKLSAQDLSDIQLIYDRAALVALPDEMRRAYCSHLGKVLPPSCQGLLISLEYPSCEHMSGPPFAVFGDEVARLLSDDWDIVLLESPEMPHWQSRFEAHELAFMREPLYRLTKR